MINSSYLTLRMPVAHSWIKDVLIVVLSSFLIALCANVAIPLPFTPVPIAVQGSLILFLAAFLGSQRAVAAVALFLFQGLIGLPVFAHGASGLFILLGPTGGYLMGYLFAAFVTGWIAERLREKTPLSLFVAMGAGNLIIFLVGAVWLSQFVGLKSALILGVAPFIAGDLLKLFVSSRLLKRYASKAV